MAAIDLSSFRYSFSYDKDLEYSNLEQINLEFGLNNFFTDFSYYIENNDIGNKENFKNKSYFTINKENKLSFEIAKNLKDDFTDLKSQQNFFVICFQK